MAPYSLLITGVSGYIGGTILTTLLTTDENWAKEVEVSALVRKASQAEAVTQLGVKPVLFETFDDEARLRSLGEEYDIIVHAGAGWHTASARAFITGQGKRRQQTGQNVYYLQISGTTNVSDRPHTQGFVDTHTFSDDGDVYSLEIHRQSVEFNRQRATDIIVSELGESLGVSTYVVMPPAIFGIGTGPFNRLSAQLPPMISAALRSGECVVVGDGKTVWSHVHIKDLAALFLVLLQNICQSNEIPSGKKGIYFCETGQHTHLEFSQRLAQAGFELGLFKSAEVKTVSLEEAANAWTHGSTSLAELAFAANARVKAVLGRKLGWKPVYGDGWEDTFKLEIQEVIKHPPPERDIAEMLLKEE